MDTHFNNLHRALYCFVDTPTGLLMTERMTLFGPHVQGILSLSEDGVREVGEFAWLGGYRRAIASPL
ncbi:MAG TPA: hypothetical protein DD440_07440 [Porticoccaceae bacterium]|nr:hypothetical protein [Porticoccaceae bacterium]